MCASPQVICIALPISEMILTFFFIQESFGVFVDRVPPVKRGPRPAEYPKLAKPFSAIPPPPLGGGGRGWVDQGIDLP